MQNNAHHPDHHRSPNWSWTKWRSQPRQQHQLPPCTTSASSQPVIQRSSSYRRQIEIKSTQWLQSQEKTIRLLQTKQQQTSICSERRDQQQQCPPDDLDSIREEDLEVLLKELELEEQRQYDLSKQLRDEQLRHGEPAQSTQEPRRIYVEQTERSEVFKQYESSEEILQYDIILKELEECERLVEAQLDSLRDFEKNKQRPLKKVNISCLSSK